MKYPFFYKLVIVPAVTFLVFAIFSAMYLWQISEQHKMGHKLNASKLASAQAHAIQKHLYHALGATYTLSTIIKEYGEVKNFDILADHIISIHKGISSLQMAPQGVVRHIYPLEGNEKAIGHNLLTDPARKDDVVKAIETEALTIAGPFNLIQGGTGVIGRLPVFLTGKDGKKTFWGFTIALIHLQNLLEETGIQNIIDSGFQYKLSRINSTSGKSVVFHQEGNSFSSPPVEFLFDVPNAKWTLALFPKNGWATIPYIYISIFTAILLCLTFSLFTWKIMRNKVELRIKSSNLEQSNRQLQQTLAEIKTLKGILPICSYCKSVRDDSGCWNRLEAYVKKHSDADFSHGICPTCMEKHYPEYNFLNEKKA